MMKIKINIFKRRTKKNERTQKKKKMIKYLKKINKYIYIIYVYIYGPRTDKRDLMAIKVKSNIFTQKERPTYCEQLMKI